MKYSVVGSLTVLALLCPMAVMAQTTIKNPPKNIKPQTIDPDALKKRTATIQRPQISTTTPATTPAKRYNDRGQMRCFGPAKRWQLRQTTSGRTAGEWVVHLWFDARNNASSGSGYCTLEDGQFLPDDSYGAEGITFEYAFRSNGSPIEEIGKRNGREYVTLKASALNRDRTMRFLSGYMGDAPAQSFVWAERTGRRGSASEYGQIWEVRNADREQGYRFPSPLQ